MIPKSTPNPDFNQTLPPAPTPQPEPRDDLFPLYGLTPEIVQGMDPEALPALADSLRTTIMRTVSANGGHLASNLGVVELSIALLRAFDVPRDQIVFDVGHQSYAYKLMTERSEDFQTLRTGGGLCGFPKRDESPYDVFGTGHASTAISAALGLARARDFKNEQHHVVAVVGDGALTGGMCYDALNDCGSSKTRLIVILNDNEMSISRNVGAISRYLTRIRVSHGYISAKKRVRSGLTRIPMVGQRLVRFVNWTKETIKSIVLHGEFEGFFDTLGFHYYGPVDGHDLKQLEHVLRQVKRFTGPCIVHVLTKKGQGYKQAEARPEAFHGVAPFFIETGDSKKAAALPAFGAVMANTLADMAENDNRIVTITAAMALGTGLESFRKRHPKRMLDVGITEEHAATLAAGLAAGGMKPYLALYATFFQRAYDQMIHDIALQQLGVTLLLDRAGVVGEDGATHHGVFDLVSLLPIPNMTILAPADINELRDMLHFTGSFDKPCAIRYGKQSIDLDASYARAPFHFGHWQTLLDGDDCAILAVGSMVAEALTAAAMLAEKGIHLQVINCSTVKPLDTKTLLALDKPFFTAEEGTLIGGFGSLVTSVCHDSGKPAPVRCFGIPDHFVSHGKRRQLLADMGLTGDMLSAAIYQYIEEMKHER